MSEKQRTIGMLVFDDVEELDFVGPWEVLAGLYHTRNLGRVVTSREILHEVARPVRSLDGARVLGDAFLPADLDAVIA